MQKITIEIKDTEIDIKMAALAALRDAEEESPGSALTMLCDAHSYVASHDYDIVLASVIQDIHIGIYFYQTLGLHTEGDIFSAVPMRGNFDGNENKVCFSLPPRFDSLPYLENMNSYITDDSEELNELLIYMMMTGEEHYIRAAADVLLIHFNEYQDNPDVQEYVETLLRIGDDIRTKEDIQRLIETFKNAFDSVSDDDNEFEEEFEEEVEEKIMDKILKANNSTPPRKFN